MANFNTGLSALQASQRALDIIGQNIANADTPGYHRQVPRLMDKLPTQIQNFLIGNGVEITEIRRLRDAILKTDLIRNTFESSNTAAQLDTLRQIETFLNPNDGSIHERLEAFFNDLERLAARPDDVALRRVVLGTAVSLTNEINNVARGLDRLRAGVEAELPRVIDEINSLAKQIAQLNSNIQRLEARGIDANDLKDQRDVLITDLAERVGVQTIEQDDGVTNVLVSGVLIIGGSQTIALATTIDSSNQAVVTMAGTTQPLTINGGRLAGLLQVRNQTLPDMQTRLNTLTLELAGQIDGLHATGMGLSGPYSSLVGQRLVSNVAVPLDSANLAFPMQAGSLFVTVTDLGTGNRTTSQVPIDPSLMSLQDVATALNGVGNLTASVDAVNGRLIVNANAGFAFDFAGRIPTSPSTAGITGTTIPQTGGSFSGSANDAYTFTMIGSGTVGVTPNLTLRVTDSGGMLIANLNIGQGYEAGSPLDAGKGVIVRMGAGTANNGDNFAIDVIAQPDTSGVLTALGLNTFFAGTNASNMRVRPELLAKPELLAASRSGFPSDASNLQRMAALRDQRLLAGGTQTLREFHADMIGDIGVRIQDLDRLQTHQEFVGQQLEAQRDSVSGVDTNEELAKMLQFQRSFQVASRFIGVVNETLESLFNIL